MNNEIYIPKIRPMTPEREIYDFLKKKYGRSTLVSQSYLKSIRILNQTSNIRFPIIVDDREAQPIAGEQLLKRSDAFMILSMAVYISKVDTGNNVNPASMIEYTFPNPGIFTGTTELPALETLYNGNLNLRIARTNVVQDLDLKRFKRVHTAQQTLEVSTGATNPAYFADGWDINEGMYALTPNIILDGRSTPDVVFNLPDSVDMTGENNTTNYAIVYMRGFYIADGAGLGGQK